MKIISITARDIRFPTSKQYFSIKMKLIERSRRKYSEISFTSKGAV